MTIFGLVFATIGGLGLYFMFLSPLLQSQAAASWVAVPGTIESSHVESHRDSDGDTTYSVAVRYRYVYDGRPYTSERYSFFTMSSSGRSGKQRVVDAMPAGAAVTCYVDPDDPSQAVIEPGLTGEVWFGLIPGAFVVIGLLLSGFGLRTLLRGPNTAVSAKAREVDWLPELKHTLEGGRVVLRPEWSAMGKFIGLLIFGLFWNGIVSIFVYEAVHSHIEGDPEWIMTIFMVPFVLIGLAILGGAVYQLLAMFNPRIVLSLDSAELRPGQVVRLNWHIDGAAGRLKGLSIDLLGTESATYRRGTDTVTDHHTFIEQPLYNTTEIDRAMRLAGGDCELAIPADAMHSFAASNNKITWKLRVRGDVPRWPDVKAEYPILVLPG